MKRWTITTNMAFVNVEYHQTHSFIFSPSKCLFKKRQYHSMNHKNQPVPSKRASPVLPLGVLSTPRDVTFELSLWAPPGGCTDLICADTCNSPRPVPDLYLHARSDASSQALALRRIKLEMKAGCLGGWGVVWLSWAVRDLSELSQHGFPNLKWDEEPNNGEDLLSI